MWKLSQTSLGISWFQSAWKTKLAVLIRWDWAVEEWVEKHGQKVTFEDQKQKS